MNAIFVPYQFRFLIDELGFRVVAGDVSTTSFDNFHVDLTNDLLNIRVLRDRGTMDAEVGPAAAPKRWFALSLVRQLVLQVDSPDDATFDEQAEFLRSHFTTVAEMLSAKNTGNTEARLLQFGREQLKKRFPDCIRGIQGDATRS